MNKDKKKREIREKEFQDAQGISRKALKEKNTLAGLYGWKILLILLIVFFYFVYSPALIFLFLAYASLFFLSVKTERAVNKSYLAKYHIKIPRFDHALALIVVLIALAGTFSGLSGSTKESALGGMDARTVQQYIKSGDFESAKKYTNSQNAKKTVEDLFTLLTGKRNVLSGTDGSFGTTKAPTNFRRPENGMIWGEARPEGMMLGEPPAGFTPPADFDFESFRSGNLSFVRFDMRASELPVYYLFSSIISTVATVIIFLVPIAAIVSMIYVARRSKAVAAENSEVIVAANSMDFSEEMLDKLLDYGEDVAADAKNEDLDNETEN